MVIEVMSVAKNVAVEIEAEAGDIYDIDIVVREVEPNYNG